MCIRDSSEVAKTLLNIGITLKVQKNYAEALNYLHRSERILNELFKGPTLDHARTLEIIGDVYMAIKEFNKALDYLQRSGDNYKAILGGNHPSYASVLVYFGMIYARRNEPILAKKYYKETLEIFNKDPTSSTYPLFHFAKKQLELIPT
eukprot:TRINITY_DN7168_c0_g1_i1.p1 TRINITY_DN7168_c0_g1~~TRINITY_DN7168_c0_g1_i1.p1  ORF type:complete len:149 (+),score=20.68 TRINITY_DN7168_c0_g1_i1:65-511(+)